LGHLQAFQDIAIANRGPDGHPSRNSGELGYDTSDRRTEADFRAASWDLAIRRR
jgi:hypothetical protein